VSNPEIIDSETGELVRVPGELVPYEAPPPATLFGTSDPAMLIERAQSHAKALVGVIRSQHLYKTIGNKNHVLVEAWTLLGSMLGVFPVVVWTRRTQDPEGWEARVEARTLAGAVVGAAEGQCTRAENMWSWEPIGKGGRKLQPRDDYALRSMAQTRATSKALRGPLGFIIVLAGYEATPAEEMPAAPANPSATGGEAKAPTQAQWGKLGATIKELDEKPDKEPPMGDSWEEYSKLYARQMWNVESRSELNRGQVAHLITHLLEGAPPF
jgi:hypothetical protein